MVHVSVMHEPLVRSFFNIITYIFIIKAHMLGGIITVKDILIVDDAAFMRISIKKILERNGYKVVGEADNGIDAIQKYFELLPDIVTMDITMPEMNGLEALKVIMSKDPNANILMISAMGQETMVKDAVLSGAKGFIVKPFKEEAMIDALGQME